MDDDVQHAVAHEMVSVNVEPDADPPKVPNAMSESRRPIPRGRSRVGASDIRAGLDAARHLHATSDFARLETISSSAAGASGKFASRKRCDQLLAMAVGFAAIAVLIIAVPFRRSSLDTALSRLMIEHPWVRIGFGAVVLVFCGWVILITLPLKLRRTPLVSHGDRRISIPGPWGRHDRATPGDRSSRRRIGHRRGARQSAPTDPR